ncbi:MAG: AarF/ABC1/UbiB kinase family protein [Desulfobacterota bacterium]|nr:AarF/ABC1/UbiB kinase family protein [Thermodesulfobacteriota bacterium]
MNWIGFVRLLRNIYGPGLPDLDAIQRQGLLAVKIGQVFALRIDFLDQEKCRHLANLYRNTVRTPSEEVRRLLKLYCGKDFLRHFIHIDDQALASASVGQVHRARTSTGDEVVIKLIKGDFKKNFVRDVRSIKRLFQTVIFFYPKLRSVADPVGILEHIEDYTLSELNLLNELRGQNILRNISLQHRDTYNLSRLRFARYYDELCSENVLVAEFVPGKTFDELLHEGKLDYEALLELFHIHGFYMFCVGTFHGDIHPGNVILSNGTICFVDTGAISRVGDKIRRGLFNFFKALALWDYGECARCLNSMSERELEGRSFEQFREKFIRLYADFTRSTVSQVSLTKKMMDTIKLGVHSGMEFEQGMFGIIKSLMYLDGMVLRCNPHAVLLHDMRRFIEETEQFVVKS